MEHGSLPTAFEDYVLNFTEAVRKTQSNDSRESSFCDLWMSQNDADKRRNWAATEAARDAVDIGSLYTEATISVHAHTYAPVHRPGRPSRRQRRQKTPKHRPPLSAPYP